MSKPAGLSKRPFVRGEAGGAIRCVEKSWRGPAQNQLSGVRFVVGAGDAGCLPIVRRPIPTKSSPTRSFRLKVRDAISTASARDSLVLYLPDESTPARTNNRDAAQEAIERFAG